MTIRSAFCLRASAIAAGVAKFDASAGCKLETWHFDYTESANYGFVDCPDEIAMATISATANAAGFVRVTFRSVLSPEDMDKALAKSLATRPPQQQWAGTVLQVRGFEGAGPPFMSGTAGVAPKAAVPAPLSVPAPLPRTSEIGVEFSESCHRDVP
jgi:hypothetical protein